MQFSSMGLSNQMGSRRNPFSPAQISGLKAWYKYDQGITVTGSGVSQWDDQSGNGNHLKQASDTKRPSKEADGSVLFDGVDNVMSADAFTLEQPETIYILGKQITWVSGDYIFDGNANNLGIIFQSGTTPELLLYAGASVASNADWILDIYAVLATEINGANSFIRINNETPTTGDPGANDLAGFTLGSRGDEASAKCANIQVKEVMIFNTAHDATTRQQVIDYLASVGNLSI